MRFQITISVIFGIVCVSAKVIMTHSFGVVGVPWATIVAYALIIALPLRFYIPKALRNLKPKPNSALLPVASGFPETV